jgi:hypothetical protein
MCGIEKLQFPGPSRVGFRLPRRGSLSPVIPSNFVLISHAFCTNSNCRKMFAFRHTK